MNDTARVAEATKVIYQSILRYAANETGVSASAALQFAGGFLGVSVLRANVDIADFHDLNPGSVFINDRVALALNQTIGNLLEVSASEGLDPTPDSGWKLSEGELTEKVRSDLATLVNSRAFDFEQLLTTLNLTWEHASLALVFVVCRIIRDVGSIVQERQAKVYIMQTLYSAAKTVPFFKNN